MKKSEAEFGKLFRAFIKKETPPSAAFELKVAGGESMSFNAVKDHQINALLAAKAGGGILYKAPDDSRGVKPFDYFYLSRACAFVVIRYPKGFEMIDVDTFVMERDKSIRKSLTHERAKQISTVSVNLG